MNREQRIVHFEYSKFKKTSGNNFLVFFAFNTIFKQDKITQNFCKKLLIFHNSLLTRHYATFLFKKPAIVGLLEGTKGAC